MDCLLFYLHHLGSVLASQAAVPRLILTAAHSFVEKLFPSSADSRRASCQLLAKEWALNTSKLPPGECG